MIKTKTLPVCLVLAFGICLALLSSSAQEGELKKLADNVYASIVSPDGNAVANAGVVVLERSVLVFDTHFTPEAGRALLAAIRAITPKPVRYLVNSHGHPDHTHGNQAFADAQIIGSTAARRHVLEVDQPALNRTMNITQGQLAQLRAGLRGTKDVGEIKRLRDQIKPRQDYVEAMSGLKITAPFLTTDDGARIREGKEEIQILYLGKGHTDGDIVLFLPAQKIAFTGDLFFNQAIPNVQDATLLDWRDTLKGLLKIPAERFVPGHGAVGGRKDVENFAVYLDELHFRVKEAVDRGDTMEQATRSIELPAKYSSYRFTNFFPSNVQKMYAELKALQPQASPDQP